MNEAASRGFIFACGVVAEASVGQSLAMAFGRGVVAFGVFVLAAFAVAVLLELVDAFVGWRRRP